MGLFSWFTGGSKVAEKVLDAGISGIDKMFFTKEEKAEFYAKLGNQWVDMMKVLQGESSIRSITRRVIAFAVIFTYIPLVLAAAGVYLWYPEYSAFLLAIADGKFGWLVITIGSFYFGPYMIQRLLTGKKGK